MGVHVAAPQKAPPQRADSQRSAAQQPSCVSCVAPSPIHRLQRGIGNRATSFLLRSPAVQPKLTVSDPGDEYEREADRVADQVMRMPDPTVEHQTRPGESPKASPLSTHISRKCQECEEAEDHQDDVMIRARRSTTGSVDVLSPVTSYVAGIRGGAPLPRSTRAHFEERFGSDFSDVRIHTGSRAAESAGSINARAYTVANNIVFNAGEYRPEGESGRHLLAHELAHVIQQRNGQPASIQRRTYSDTFATVAYLSGPIWNVHLTITNAPEEDTERLEEFINACHDGVMSAARELGERPAISSREIRIRIRFSAGMTEQAISQRAYELALASLPRPRRPAGEATQAEPRQRPRHSPADPSDEPRLGETDYQRIRRQASTSLRVLSNVVADADAEGYNRVVLNIENNGREIIPGFAKEQQGASRTGQTSAYAVRDHLRVYFDEITTGPGRWQIVFTRQGNAMRFSRFERVPEAATTQQSEEDELRALGIPNRREIYAGIFRETERQLQEAGIMIAGFAIEQLVLWVVGGVLFRALGLVGRAAFPRILALIQRGTPASLATGLEVLSASERAEFGVLMQRVESGALSAVERTRLTALLTRLEAALPASLTRTAAGVMSRIRIPRVIPWGEARLGAFDTELVRRAAEIRATQAGLSLEAFTQYNVAVARVRTASGEIVYLEAGNLPGGMHSEQYILGQLRDRALGLGRGARVEQLYTERIPCGPGSANCSDLIRRYFGGNTEVYYTVGNEANRGRILMERYGL